MNGTFPADYPRFLRVAGLAIWAVVGLPVLASSRSIRALGASNVSFAAWAAAFILFGAAFLRTTAAARFDHDRTGTLALLAAQSAAVLALVALPPCYGLEGALLVLVALQLGGRLAPRAAIAWVVAQSAALFVTIALHWNTHAGVMLAGAYFPFQLLAFWTAHLLARETGERDSLARANAELQGTRELLAETNRISERARISRELHDLLGHHLTAMALNLETASHLAGGEPRVHIEAARDRARALLGEVRDTVRAMRNADGIRLDAAVQALVAGIDRPRIHLRFEEALPNASPASAQVLFRCAQEIVTNAVRHSRAENLWLDFVRSGDGLEIQARDDGRGAGSIGAGGGLTGMRERLEERGGRLAVRSEPGRGFEVVAALPAAHG
ncbi:MAG: histidine kinase [Acidobacteriota bacterium]|nr:histidine kinase [Acidobacteriota bacterium]